MAAAPRSSPSHGGGGDRGSSEPRDFGGSSTTPNARGRPSPSSAGANNPGSGRESAKAEALSVYLREQASIIAAATSPHAPRGPDPDLDHYHPNQHDDDGHAERDAIGSPSNASKPPARRSSLYLIPDPKDDVPDGASDGDGGGGESPDTSHLKTQPAPLPPPSLPPSSGEDPGNTTAPAAIVSAAKPRRDNTVRIRAPPTATTTTTTTTSPRTHLQQQQQQQQQQQPQQPQPQEQQQQHHPALHSGGSLREGRMRGLAGSLSFNRRQGRFIVGATDAFFTASTAAHLSGSSSPQHHRSPMQHATTTATSGGGGGGGGALGPCLSESSVQPSAGALDQSDGACGLSTSSRPLGGTTPSQHHHHSNNNHSNHHHQAAAGALVHSVVGAHAASTTLGGGPPDAELLETLQAASTVAARATAAAGRPLTEPEWRGFVDVVAATGTFGDAQLAVLRQLPLLPPRDVDSLRNYPNAAGTWWCLNGGNGGNASTTTPTLTQLSGASPGQQHSIISPQGQSLAGVPSRLAQSTSISAASSFRSGRSGFFHRQAPAASSGRRPAGAAASSASAFFASHGLSGNNNNNMNNGSGAPAAGGAPPDIEATAAEPPLVAPPADSRGGSQHDLLAPDSFHRVPHTRTQSPNSLGGSRPAVSPTTAAAAHQFAVAAEPHQQQQHSAPHGMSGASSPMNSGPASPVLSAAGSFHTHAVLANAASCATELHHAADLQRNNNGGNATQVHSAAASSVGGSSFVNSSSGSSRQAIATAFVPAIAAKSFQLTAHDEPVCRPVEVDAAVMFVDISGYSDASRKLESRGAFALFEVVNSYFDRIIDVCDTFGGEVVKFAGDAITILWYGAHIPVGGCVCAAAQCALALQKSCQTSESAYLDESLRIHVAIAAGRVRSSVFRSTTVQHMEPHYHFLEGQPLDEVGVLLDRAAPGEICISQAAAESLCCTNALQWNSFTDGVADAASPPASPDGLLSSGGGGGVGGGAALSSATFLSATSAPARRNAAPDAAPKAVPSMKLTAMGARCTCAAAPQKQFRSIDSDVELDEERRKENIAKFIHPAVREQIKQGALQAEMAKMRLLTALFIHKTDPHTDVSDWFAEVQATVDEHRACVVQILRDDKGIVVIAAVNLHNPDREPAATGIRIAKALIERRTGSTVGVAAGNTFCGVVGNQLASRFDITGAPCVRACRLMQYGVKHGHPIVIGDNVVEHSGDLSLATPIGTVLLKGSTEKITIFKPATVDTRILSSITSANRFSSEAHAAHYERLRREVADTHVQRQAALIRGPNGTGKTFLAIRVVHRTTPRIIPLTHVAVENSRPHDLLWTVGTWFEHSHHAELAALARDVLTALRSNHNLAATQSALSLVDESLRKGLRHALIVRHCQRLDSMSLSFLRQSLATTSRGGDSETILPERRGPVGRWIVFVTYVPQHGQQAWSAVSSSLGANIVEAHVGPLDDAEGAALASHCFGWTCSAQLAREVKAFTGNNAEAISHACKWLEPRVTIGRDGIVRADKATICQLRALRWDAIASTYCAKLSQIIEPLSSNALSVLRVFAALHTPFSAAGGIARAFAVKVALSTILGTRSMLVEKDVDLLCELSLLEPVAGDTTTLRFCNPLVPDVLEGLALPAQTRVLGEVAAHFFDHFNELADPEDILCYAAYHELAGRPEGRADLVRTGLAAVSRLLSAAREEQKERQKQRQPGVGGNPDHGDDPGDSFVGNSTTPTPRADGAAPAAHGGQVLAAHQASPHQQPPQPPGSSPPEYPPRPQVQPTRDITQQQPPPTHQPHQQQPPLPPQQPTPISTTATTTAQSPVPPIFDRCVSLLSAVEAYHERRGIPFTQPPEMAAALRQWEQGGSMRIVGEMPHEAVVLRSYLLPISLGIITVGLRETQLYLRKAIVNAGAGNADLPDAVRAPVRKAIKVFGRFISQIDDIVDYEPGCDEASILRKFLQPGASFDDLIGFASEFVSLVDSVVIGRRDKVHAYLLRRMHVPDVPEGIAWWKGWERAALERSLRALCEAFGDCQVTALRRGLMQLASVGWIPLNPDLSVEFQRDCYFRRRTHEPVTLVSFTWCNLQFSIPEGFWDS